MGIDVAAGAVHFPQALTFDEQRALAADAMARGAADACFYTPIVRGGHPMSVRMLCLGRHWNALTYRYEDSRVDIDQRAVPPLPASWADLASRFASDAGFELRADLCILNWYAHGSRMGLHQDKDESRGSIEAGAPVVSVSIGETGRFLFGGLRRKDRVQSILLRSGDVFVFGGASRLCYHGVSRVIPGTAPAGLGFEGRLSFTFRQY